MDNLNPSCLEYRLTDAERAKFDQDGFFAIENALSAEQVNALTKVVDRIFEAKKAAGDAPGGRLFYGNFIPDSPLFLDLVDYHKVLPKVWDILGWNIYLYHAHLIVTAPSGEAANDKTFGWHQDSGRTNVEMESDPRPRLSLKVAYFLPRQLLGGARQPFEKQYRQTHRGQWPTGRRHSRIGQARHGRLF